LGILPRPFNRTIVPTRVSFYASGDGMVTGWSVAGEISFDKFSDLFKFLKPQDDTNQEE
jgi:hypothetical protein